MNNRSSNFYKKIHKPLCVFFSATMFIQSGFAGTPSTSLTKTDIESIKKHFNSLGMGKEQTLEEWYQKAQKTLDPDFRLALSKWVEQNKSLKIPNIEVNQKFTKLNGKYFLFKFSINKTESLNFELHKDKNGFFLVVNNKHYREKDILTKNNTLISNQKTVENSISNGPFLEYNYFRKLAKSNPELGLKYARGFRELLKSMEQSQYSLLFNKNKRKVSLFEILLTKSFAQNADIEPSCLIGAWFGQKDENTKFCDKIHDVENTLTLNPYECPIIDGKAYISCNPYIFGYASDVPVVQGENKMLPPHCVPQRPKEEVSVECDKKSPLNSTQDLEKMLNNIDYLDVNKLGKKDNPGFAIRTLKNFLDQFAKACFKNPDDSNQLIADIKADRNTKYYERFDKHPGKKNDASDPEFHNRAACEVVYKRLAFLDEIKEESIKELTPVKTQELCEDPKIPYGPKKPCSFDVKKENESQIVAGPQLDSYSGFKFSDFFKGLFGPCIDTVVGGIACSALGISIWALLDKDKKTVHNHFHNTTITNPPTTKPTDPPTSLPPTTTNCADGTGGECELVRPAGGGATK